MNYISKIIEALKEEIPDCDDSLLGLYSLLVLSKGIDTTLSDVHDAWAVWRNVTNPNHKSLIPFSELSQEVQDLDTKYMEAIHKISILGE